MKTIYSLILSILFIILLGLGHFGVGIFAKTPLPEPELNVIEKTDLFKNIEIDPNDVSSYRDFIKNNGLYQKPISKAELLKQIKGARDYLEAHPLGKTTKDLREKIISELNIGFLLHELDKRELVVTLTGVRQFEEYREEELLFHDPQVGTFSALLLVPKKEKRSNAAIIGLPGHGHPIKVFRDEYLVGELAKEGLAVIIPFFRAMNHDKTEVNISEELYLNGFTLMGLRVYETLLLIKYLKYKDFVSEDKIGIMGHSGGNTVAFLTAVISRDLQALVYDMYPEQLNMCYGKIHCQTIPGLAYYDPQIYIVTSLKIPLWKLQYGYFNPDDMRKMVLFFKEKLTEK